MNSRLIDSQRLVLVAAMVLCSAALSAEEILPPLTVRSGFGSGQQGMDFPVSNVDIGTDTLRPAPNTPLYFVIGAAWREVGVSVSFTVPGTLDRIDERGVSEYTNLQLQFYRRRLAFDLSYQNHRGMYLTNYDEITAPPDSARLPDMDLETIGVTAIWTGHTALNLAAMYRLNALPERSAAGVVWMAAASRVRLNAPEGPGLGITALNGTVWSQDMKLGSYSVIAGPGVVAIGTFRSFFIAPLFSFGVGLQRSEFVVAPGSGIEWNLVPQLSVRLSGGFNGPTWFAAIVVIADARNVRTPFLEATQTSSRVDLVVGRRFRVPPRLDLPGQAAE